MPDYPSHVTHIYKRVPLADEYNTKMLNRLDQSKVTVPCNDTIVSPANIAADKQAKLVNSLPDDMNKTDNLKTNLTVAVGMLYDITVNVDVEDGLTNGSSCIVKYIENRMANTNRPSIIWVQFDDKKIGQNTRKRYMQKGFYNNTALESSWTPIFDVQRNFIYNYKTYQRIQFPLNPSAAKSVWKAQGSTMDEIVVDLTGKKIPHIHYTALSKVRSLKGLYILNFNETSLMLDEKVNEEMDRLHQFAMLQLCYVPLYTYQPDKYLKVAFNNVRSLNFHFHDVQNEPNIIDADIIGFCETRLCGQDCDTSFKIEGYQLLRNDQNVSQQTQTISCEEEAVHSRRPPHGLAVYVKQRIKVSDVHNFSTDLLEFTSIVATLNNDLTKYQIVFLYKSPKCPFSILKHELSQCLQPVLAKQSKLIIAGDFIIDANALNDNFFTFMQTSFGTSQHISNSTTDHGSSLDLIFTNCEVSVGTVESFWSDHKIVYCAIPKP